MSDHFRSVRKQMNDHFREVGNMIRDTPISDTPISDSTPHNVGDLAMACRRLERKLAATRKYMSEVTERANRMEAVTNDPHALWANWLRGSVTLPEGIGDVREYQERIKMLENLQLQEEHLSEIERENKRLNEQNKRQNELIDSLREMYAKEAKP